MFVVALCCTVAVGFEDLGSDLRSTGYGSRMRWSDGTTEVVEEVLEVPATVLESCMNTKNISIALHEDVGA